MQQNSSCQSVILHILIIFSDSLTCKQHFNILAGWDGANFNYYMLLGSSVFKNASEKFDQQSN